MDWYDILQRHRASLPDWETVLNLTPTIRPHTPHRNERHNPLPLLDVLCIKGPFSSASNPLERTLAAPICILFSQGEHSHCQWQGTSIAMFRLCNAHASAGVALQASNRRVQLPFCPLYTAVPLPSLEIVPGRPSQKEATEIRVLLWGGVA